MKQFSLPFTTKIQKFMKFLLDMVGLGEETGKEIRIINILKKQI